MEWRLHEHVTRGEIDNRTRGRVRGQLWLSGVAEPLRLELEGDCEPDLAGCHLQFENPKARAMKTPPPAPVQRGKVGFISAAHKVRGFDVPVETAIAMQRRGEEPPSRLANALHLGWFSDLSGQIVIESSDFMLEVSAPAWRFTAAEIAEREGQHATDNSDETEVYDEFRSEQLLRESDSKTEKYGELLKRYKDHPDRDRIIAREMGWTWLEEALEEHDDEVEQFGKQDYPADDLPPWSEEDESGDHPISKHATDVLDELLAELQAANLYPDGDDEAVHSFFSAFMILSVKLAGASALIGEDAIEDHSGLAIAFLKRALVHLNETLTAADPTALSKSLSAERVAHYRTELFAVREEMLKEIARLRG